MIKIPFSNYNSKTVSLFLKDKTSVAYGISISDFLAFTDEDGVSNKESILSEYDKIERDLVESESISDKDLLIKFGTVLSIPEDKIQKGNLDAIRGVDVVSYDSPAFFEKRLVELYTDENYKKDIAAQKQTKRGSVVYNPDATVYIWSKTLYENDGQDPENSRSGFIDVTAAVNNLQTVSQGFGGSFSFSLAPMEAELIDGRWQKKRSSSYSQNNIGTSLNVSTPMVSKGNQGYKKSNFLFEEILQKNDLVFIRFEKLQNERDREDTRGNQAPIDKFDIPNKIYDMIGLVHTVVASHQSNSEMLSYNITVQGNDLSNVFMSDGVYFSPIEFAQNRFYFGQSAGSNNSDIKRFAGKLFYYSMDMFNDIEYLMKLVINTLSVIKIADNDIFSAFESKREDSYKDSERGLLEKTDVNGIYKIIDLVIDSNVLNRKVVDGSISTDQGAIVNFFRKICQEPFVQCFCDTYKDKYHVVVRKPPFDKSSMFSIINKDIIYNIDRENFNLTDSLALEEGRFSMIRNVESEDVLSDSLMYENEKTYAWYNLRYQILNFSNDSLSTAVIPSVYYKEYGDIYGAKVCSEVSNYVPHKDYTNIQNDLELNNIYDQAYKDLQFIIFTNCYLPFTRRGVITIQGGDRTIKKGTFIRYKPTNEIFYVDSVSHSLTKNKEEASVDRKTVLRVSRGMVEDYIKGVKVEGIDEIVSYFNLIKFELKEPEGKSEKVEEEFDTEIPKSFKIYFPNDAATIVDGYEDGNTATNAPMVSEGFTNTEGTIWENRVDYGLNKVLYSPLYLLNLFDSIKDNSDIKISLNGFASVDGYRANNKKLSEARAKNVQRFIEENYLFDDEFKNERFVKIEGRGEKIVADCGKVFRQNIPDETGRPTEVKKGDVDSKCKKQARFVEVEFIKIQGETVVTRNDEIKTLKKKNQFNSNQVFRIKETYVIKDVFNFFLKRRQDDRK